VLQHEVLVLGKNGRVNAFGLFLAHSIDAAVGEGAEQTSDRLCRGPDGE
jgi:hypothetical protein